LNVPGIKLASVKAGIKYKDRKDLSLIMLDEGSVVSGLFTKNKFRAAPVQVCQNHLKAGSHKRGLLINTGSANAGTGSEGFDNAMQICSELATNLKVQAHDILPFSTGVILTHIPVNKIVGQLTNLIESLDESHWLDVAEAIMTTDTVPKAYSKKIKIQNEDIVITGISKGSGMICPIWPLCLLSLVPMQILMNQYFQKFTKRLLRIVSMRLVLMEIHPLMIPLF